MITAQQEAIAELCRRYQVERLEVFGSATRPDFDAQRSDVHFLVTFLPGSTDLDGFLGLAEGLEALLDRPVDLVVERAIRNPYFRQTVADTRRLIYAHPHQEAAV